MNNKDLINALAQTDGLKATDTQSMVLTAVKAIIEKMCDAEPVNLNGLGTFDVRKRNERIIVNPGTGKKNLVPPKLVATFKPKKK
jgi:nucleoid DNA-binding protein